jgi:hypothetical protein
MKKFLLATAVFAFSVTGNAQESMGKTSAEFSVPTSSFFDSGFRPFLGLSAGYTPKDDQIPVEGVPTSAKLIGSYYFSGVPFVTDLGLGIGTQNFTRRDAEDRYSMGSALELAARYALPYRWQVGAVANDFFTKGRLYGASQADAQFVGLRD